MWKATAIASMLLGASIVPVQAAAPAPVGQQIEEEVLVEGGQVKLNEMRQELVELQDRFYERYNELNTNDDFDVHCALDARVGTQLKRRSCRVVYESKAEQSEGQAYFFDLQRQLDSSAPQAAGSFSPPVPAVMAIEGRRKEFRRNMLEVTRSHRELIELARQHAELAQRYEAARRELFGRKGPPEEDGAPP